MKGRQRYECIGCGLTVEGRAQPDGTIRAYDRAPHDGSPTRQAICLMCNETKSYLKMQDGHA